MKASELGQRLRVAREARGLSQQAVADVVGLPRTAVTQMEAGKRSVSTLELSKLSELYFCPVADFLQEDTRDEDMLVALYRAVPGLEQDSIREQVARCVGLCREGVGLERLLGIRPRSGPPSYPTHMPRSSGEAVAQGEQTAIQERRRLEIGHAPIADVSGLIASQGIWALSVKLPKELSGLFLQHPSIGLVVLVNSSHPRGRKRFSYAHEYAHALLDRDRNQNGNTMVSSTNNSSEVVEKRANAFAAAFLMPRGGVYDTLRGLGKGLPSRQEQTVFNVASDVPIEAELRSPAGSQRIAYKDIAKLAHHFGVSYQAALYRLKSLRYISYRESLDLLQQEQVGRRYLEALDMFDDVDKPEQRQYCDRELRSEIVHLAIEAYRRDEISRGRILELSRMLGINGDTLLHLAEATRGE